MRQFDGSAATIKKIPPVGKVAELAVRKEVSVFGADVMPNCAVFDSETDRFPD